MSSRPKIALVTSGLGTRHGGIGVVAAAIVCALRTDSDVRVLRHPPHWPRMLRAGAIGLQALLATRNIDLVIYDHVHLAVLHAIFPSLRRVPYAVFLHGMELWVPLTGRRREALLGANLLVSNSATTEELARRVNPWLPKAEVTWLGVSEQVHPVGGRPTPPVGLIVGRMACRERLKGHDAVMDAWPDIRSVVPDAQLVIVGTGDDKARLQTRAKNEQLAGVSFRGRLSDRERDKLYASSRLLFYPSQQEGFGLAAIEAGSFGVPVLGLAGTVMEELFPEGTIVLAKDLSRRAILDAAVPLLGDAQLASDIGQAARNRVRSTFLHKHFASRLRTALAKVIPAYEQVQPQITSAAEELQLPRRA